MIGFSNCKCKVEKGKFDINNIPLDCPAVYRLLASGNTVGVFQLETKLGQDWSRKLQPESIEELSALISLLRPGPLNSGLSQEYVDIKFGKKKATYLHSKLKSILEPTYGVMSYQEQALKIAIDLAGFNPIEADTLRSSIGKKKADLMAKLKPKFIEGCQKHSGIDKEVAEEIFGWIEKCQRYSFNKCIVGGTVIRRTNKGKSLKTSGYTIEHMYHIRNDIRYAKKHGHEMLRRKWNGLGHYGKGLSLCEDGRIRPNIIRDIQSAGYRDTFKVTLENGKTISVTANHKFPTPQGERMLGQLDIGDYLYTCGEYEQSDFSSISKFSDKTNDYKERRYKHPQCGFPSGSANPAYTNGSYTDLREYQRSIPDICEKCGKINCRIETAHLNGDRTNSSPENLKKLCVSCHKKHDYSNGRMKKGEKGYPFIETKIKSIVRNGTEEVWDVTMDGPEHNLVVNDNIITSNSHAVGYTLGLSYPTAWVKCHFPKEFFTSYLTYSNYKTDPKEEIYRLIQDARLFDVNILPPDIRRGNIPFKIVEKPQGGIVFGLGHVRGVGSSAIEKIVSAGSGSLETWSGFLRSVPHFHRNVGIALIKSGACDCYDRGRNEMVRELEVILGTTIRDDEGVKVEIKGLTQKEKDYFFGQLEEDLMTTQEILTQMAHPADDKKKTIKQMLKSELIEVASNFLGQVAISMDGVLDSDSEFVYTSKDELEIWLDNLKSRKKNQITALMLENGYQDMVVKSPCASDARRRKMLEKAELLEDPVKDTSRSNSIAEKHFLGIALSCSPADEVDHMLATHTCLEIAKAHNKETIVVCAIIDGVRHTKTKRGKNPGRPMCFLTISDSTYSIDPAVVFPDVFPKLKAFCKEDLICLIFGEKVNGSFIVKDIQKLI